MRVNREEVTKKDLVYYGPRFDIYAEDEFGTIYDLEMQNSDKGDLAERMSMYQASLERNALLAGEDFRKRRRTVVIFICNFDAFKKRLAAYYIGSKVLNCLELKFDNKETNAIVNLKGELSAENTARQALNAYFTKQIVSDEFTAQIDQAVQALKQDSKRGAIYMEAKEWVAREVARFRTDSFEEGREEGLSIGRRDGMTLALAILSDIPKLIAANKGHEEIITTLVAKYNINQEQAESYYEQVMALRA